MKSQTIAKLEKIIQTIAKKEISKILASKYKAAALNYSEVTPETLATDIYNFIKLDVFDDGYLLVKLIKFYSVRTDSLPNTLKSCITLKKNDPQAYEMLAKAFYQNSKVKGLY